MDVKELLGSLTVEEKAALVAGTDFMYTNPVPRLKIGQVRLSDGPHGLRVQTEGGDNGVTASLPATSFPTAATVACGWNGENAAKIGGAIGEEAHKYGINVVLGPGANIKRNPLAGRNFEYYSEDPLLSGSLAAEEIKGIQSRNVAACLKHFALNNAENYRFLGDSVADMRAMREIYLKVFEIAVKQAAPDTVMCAYNKINGEYCSQNGWLLNEVLRDEWGFKGLVMTDWGAMHDRIASLRAGLDLEMPGDTAICRKWICDGVKDGSLPMSYLDRAVENVLRLVEKYARSKIEECDFVAHDRLACAVAEDCAVLLKNDGALPLAEGEKLFVCGDLFERMRYQGSGSSMINPTRLITPRTAFDDMGIAYEYARGYKENQISVDGALIEKALRLGRNYDKVIVFAGLTDYVESEGGDREDMRLPENQLALIKAFTDAGKKVIVVLFGGAPFELPFADEACAILNMYLPGQSGGRACANLLFDRVNPSGKLAETWPLSYSDVPFGDKFAKSASEVYKESIFVGYRYYCTAGVPVRYPFGYGLSYTKFVSGGMKATDCGDEIRISAEVENVGGREGAEVVQIYSSKPVSGVFRPLRELRAYKKVYLPAGGKCRVELTVKKSDLRYFDIQRNDWVLEGGEYVFELCSDSATPVCSDRLTIAGEECSALPERVGKVYGGAHLSSVTDELFEAMSGLKIPAAQPLAPVTLESRFSDLAHSRFMGRMLHSIVVGVADGQMKSAKKMPEGKERDNKVKGAIFLKRILESNSLMSMTMCAGGSCPYNVAQGFMHFANGRIFKGIKCFCTKIKASKLPKEEKK